MRGRKPKPSALRELEGDVSHRPKNDAEPKPAADMPTMPKALTGAARKAWERLAPELHQCGLLTAIDGDLLESYARMYAHAAECWKRAKADGPVVIVAGQPRANPYAAEAMKAEDRLHKLRQEMGLTPVSRSRIKVDKPEENEESLDAFLKMSA